jgi:hypothetical protein
VTTKEGWMRRRLAAQCTHALVEDVLGHARDNRKAGKVKVQVHTVEELNRGFCREKG